MIEIQNLAVLLEEEKVLTDCNAIFQEGEINVIIGKSGSGKSVLMKTILGIHDYQEGEIFLSGEPMSQLSVKQQKVLRSNFGVVFQHGALFDSMTALENVCFPLRMLGKERTLKQKLERAAHCLEMVGLPDDMGKYISELSGGMQKRVAIARAIAFSPKYLFCDEPNSGLDPKTSTRIDELLFDLTKELKITTIVNTHDLNSVIEIGENVFYVHDRTIFWTGKKGEVLNTDNPQVQDFIYVNSVMKHMKQNLGTK